MPVLRKPATVCPCGWIHKHGVEPKCAFALAALRRQRDEEQQPKPASRRRPRRPATADARSAYARRQRRPEYRWSVLKSQAKRRRLTCDLPFDFFPELIRRPCHYCGAQTEKFRGVDRVDNDLGYIRANVVACCSTCNYMKGELGKDQFLAHARRVYMHARPSRAGSLG